MEYCVAQYEVEYGKCEGLRSTLLRTGVLWCLFIHYWQKNGLDRDSSGGPADDQPRLTQLGTSDGFYIESGFELPRAMLTPSGVFPWSILYILG